MGYSNDQKFIATEPNSVSLAMFASVGFHAVLFVLMAFFPASSETVKKPLRIVNLLPPGSSSSTSLQPQAKTSTLEDILQNPLPDLSAGFPPIGNADESSIQAAPDSSSYFGGGSSYGNRVDTSNLKTTDPPNRSFTPSPLPDPLGASNPSSPQTPKSDPPSSITSAPNTSIGQSSPPSTPNTLPEPPNLIGAAPEPTGLNNIPPLFPDSDQGTFNPASGEPRSIAPSKQKVVPIISTSVPYEYPKAACPKALQGTATLTYYRQPDGTYVEGSGVFENSSGSQLLNDVALNAVVNSTAAGTGDFQRYSSRFDFLYSEDACAGVSASTPPASPSSPTQPSTEPPAQSETQDSDSSKPKSSDESKSAADEPKNDSKTVEPSDTQKPDNSKTPTPKASDSSKPKVDNSGADNMPASPQPQPSVPSDPVPKENLIKPQLKPKTPQVETPKTPSDVPTEPSPASESNLKPQGAASDLVPLESATPPAQPQPEPVSPPALKVPLAAPKESE